MDNREKAQAIITDLFGFHSISLAGKIEKTLDRIDAPEPKKWEPREGCYPVGYVASRWYPTIFEADLAKPLHLKMDRLVNWLVEHHKKTLMPDLADFDGEFSLSLSPAGSLRITFVSVSGKNLIDAILSGEVEL